LREKSYEVGLAAMLVRSFHPSVQRTLGCFVTTSVKEEMKNGNRPHPNINE
jgi:hypothetical protein